MEIKEVREGNIAEEVTAPVTREPEEAQETSEEEHLDYQALYEKEKEKRSKAEYTLYKKSKESRQQREENSDSPSTSIIDQSEIRKIVEEETTLRLEAQRQKDSEDIIDEEIRRLSSNEDEQRLIRFKYDNSLVKTGYSRLAIREDLEDARFLANKTKYQKEKNELAQSAIARRTTGNTGAGTSQTRSQAPDDFSKHFTPADWQFIQRNKWSNEKIKEAIANKI